MTDQPITPPPELREQWECEWREHKESETVIGWSVDLLTYVTDRSAQWGADKEREAICERLEYLGWHSAVQDIRAPHCPKPRSLKEKLTVALYDGNIGQALRLVEQLDLQ